MGLEKIGMSLAQRTTSFVKASGKTSILQTKPTNFKNIKFSELKYQQNPDVDKFELTNELQLKGNKLTAPFKQIIVKPDPEGTSIIKAYRENGKRYNIVDFDEQCFYKSCNPITMPHRHISDKEIVHICTYHYPYGTISATTTMNKCITTDNLAQCAAVAIVNPKNNTQTLAHCFPLHTQKQIDDLLKNVIKNNNPKDLKITIVHGSDYYTESTVVAIKNAINKISPNATIQYANFPKSAHYDKGIMLQNGQLSAFNGAELKKAKKIINPQECISYVLTERNKNKNICMFRDTFEDKILSKLFALGEKIGIKTPYKYQSLFDYRRLLPD